MKMAAWVHTLHPPEFFYEFENFISPPHFYFSPSQDIYDLQKFPFHREFEIYHAAFPVN